MAYNPRDFYFKQAKAKSFAARSVFKLEEIDQRFHVLKKGDKVLDLGAAPGSWAQYCSKKTGPAGRIFGIDLKEIKITLPNAIFVQADIRAADLAHIMATEGIAPPFNVVLSDMAPSTTGIKLTDQMRSHELCEIALEAAEKYLKPGGNFICKLFHSDQFSKFRDKLRDRFEKVELLKPKSTRKESKEIFFIALKKKD